ncbi:tail fiber assembly protein [Aeromonas hydrophila]|mgnify:CR=1 FL=1|uniref:tail fiber assembly protein n=1 Tax=Aeromonas TaxID=642 RepID=UPI00111AEE37|nr:MULTISPECIES: tail fiber assembly protein [Aeromonas]MBM0511410.1 hypothetical protein [Aeromonas hydrophila]MBW3770996.1 hypothetical protein [Aeromonas hydrophila]MCX4103547.1 tail fiber assembly protein [Aeromonas hydrophila]TNJ17218.1 hypothetical protein CF112_19690 [Aeromonas hydrophila]
MKFGVFDLKDGRLKAVGDIPEGATPEITFGVMVPGDFTIGRHYLNNAGVVCDAGASPGEHYIQAGVNGWVVDVEVSSARVRAQRDVLLSQSDWVELPSNRERMTDQQLADWFCYRQALRDITNQPAFPEVVWPVRPA